MTEKKLEHAKALKTRHEHEVERRLVAVKQARAHLDEETKIRKKETAQYEKLCKAAKNGDLDAMLEQMRTYARLGKEQNNIGALHEYINRQDKNGSTALFHAVWPNHIKAVQLLINNGGGEDATLQAGLCMGDECVM